MKKLILILIFGVLTTGIKAKSPGKFLKYNQVTDKEVIIESTKGHKVLFKAYDNNNIGVSYFNNGEEVTLIAPVNVFAHAELSGSIYVEELDELMQITTTTANGLMVRIDKKHFGFTFIDKTDDSELVFEEGQTSGTVSNKQTFCIVADTSDYNGKTVHPRL